MKIHLNKIALSLIITLSLILTSCKDQKPRDLLFFYFESCPSCDEYIMAEKLNEEILRLNKKRDWNARFYNLITPESGAELKKILNEKGLPDISRSLPLLIIDNEYINGYDEIEEKLDMLLSEK